MLPNDIILYIYEFKHNLHMIDLKEDIKSLRSEFLDTRRVLMKYKMESFIKDKLSEKGIISSNTPPIKITINVNK